MAYSSFTLAEVMTRFGIAVDTFRDLFAHIAPVPLRAVTRRGVRDNLPLARLAGNENSRAGLLVAPVLAELWHSTDRRVSLSCDVALDVDAEGELNVACNYLIGRAPQLPHLTLPLFAAVETRTQNTHNVYGQCAAEMIAALRLNAAANTGVPTVYGCVTDGVSWRFMRLTGVQLDIDLAEYQLAELDRIFGILLFMVAAALPPAAPRPA